MHVLVPALHPCLSTPVGSSSTSVLPRGSLSAVGTAISMGSAASSNKAASCARRSCDSGARSSCVAQ